MRNDLTVHTSATKSDREHAFTARAEWLSEQLELRDWKAKDVPAWGGPSYLTVIKILRGEPVSQPILIKLAWALSLKRLQISEADIPSA